MKRRNIFALLTVVLVLTLVAAPAAASWLTRFNSVLVEHDLQVDGDTTLNTLTVTSGTFTSAAVGASQVFEGATADDYETTLTVTDPTADRTVTIPNATGTVMLSSLATNAPDVANSVWGASNGLVFEGATGGADAYETTITPTDPTADRTITLPNATGTVMLGSGATKSVFGITSTFTGTIAVTHGLSAVTGALASLCQDSAAAAASLSTSISGTTVTIKAWKADGSTAADVGTTACYVVYGTP